MVLREIYETKNAEVTEEVVRQIGWSEYHQEEEEMLRRAKSLAFYVKLAIGKEKLEESYLWNHVSFKAQNLRDREYGKFFDRYVFCDQRFDEGHSFRGNRILGDGRAYTVIANMNGAGAKYLVFETGKAVPIAKFRSVGSVAEFLYEKFQ